MREIAADAERWCNFIPCSVFEGEITQTDNRIIKDCV